MKLVFTTVLAMMLATPALATKEAVKPVKRPTNTCQEELMFKQMIYHLDAIEMMIEEMREDALRQFPKPKPKVPSKNQ